MRLKEKEIKSLLIGHMFSFFRTDPRERTRQRSRGRREYEFSPGSHQPGLIQGNASIGYFFTSMYGFGLIITFSTA